MTKRLKNFPSRKEKKRRESIIQDFKTINANRDKKTLEKYISLAENDAYDLTNNPDNKKDGSIQVKTSRRQSVAIVNELNSAKKILKELNSLDNHRKEAEKLNDDDFKNYVDQGLKNVDIQVAKAALTLMNMPKASLMDDKAIEGMLSAGGKQSLPSLIKKHNIQNTELNTSNDALAILRSNLNNHSGLFGTKKIQEITDNQTTIKLHNWVYHTANEVSRRRQSLIVNNWEKPKFEDLNQGPRLSKVEEENFKKSPNWVKAKVGNLKKSGNSDGGIKTDSSFSKSELGKDTDVAERTFVRDNEVKPMKQKQKIGPIGTSMAQSPTPETTFGDANELKKRQKKTKLKKISKNTKIESGEE